MSRRRPSLGRDRGGLQAEPVRRDRACSLVHDAVRRLAALSEREVESRKRELDPDHIGVKHANGCLEKLLPGLIALEHDDGSCVHDRRSLVVDLLAQLH